MMGWCQDLPGIDSLWQEEIQLDRSFEEIAVPFAQSEGTVFLLSGSSLDCARYEILGLMPWMTLKGTGRTQSLTVDGNSRQVEMDPFEFLNGILAHFSLPPEVTDLPLGAGLLGYFSYDLKDSIEKLPITCLDPGLPEMVLYAHSLILVRDRQAEKTFLCIPLPTDRASDHVEQIKARFFQELEKEVVPGSFSMDSRGFRSCYEKAEYMDAVEKIIQYLRAGDIYQANLSQRFETGFEGDPYTLFRNLFKQNPAPFFSYVHAGDHVIVSTSPERFIKQTGSKVETRPIKGTLARGKTPEEDRRNGEILSASKKDDAEITMIVDLMRNDLSRVTKHGSVVVSEHKRLEPYDNVFHLVSIVNGELLPGKTSVDLIQATFPGGSITGCPKIRAMEIIDELEPFKRHVYTGSIGYVSFHETMDLSIAIRTATIVDRSIFFSVGGGIVYDSNPESEFQETLDKGKTLMDILSAGSTGTGNEIAGEEITPRAWVDGKMVDQDLARVPAMGHGSQYGSGLFETIRVEQGRPVRLDAHLARMNRAWEHLYHCPAPGITWEDVIALLIRENRLEDQVAAVKLMVSPDGTRTGKQFTLAAFARPYVHRLEALGKDGLDLVTYPHPRQTPLAAHKTLNYLFYERAGDHARSRGGDEALILNPDETVSETNTANLIIKDGDTIRVPESLHVLPGTAQDSILDGLRNGGDVIVQEPVALASLHEFDGVVATNALMGAVAVRSLDGRPLAVDSEFCDRVNRLLARES
ncbi:MAG: aminodeoxychorismate synthase component I [Desulfobacterales bacterium]|nr:aminodeoxychorismate synthase component I [Desulfobacterales bacterium]